MDSEAGTLRNRRELVLAMTVAEIFLLLLFVVWSTTAVPQGGIDVSGLNERVERLTKENEELREQSEIRGRLIQALTNLLRMIGRRPPDSEAELENWVERETQLANGSGGRGLPACIASDNVALLVRARDGVLTVTVRTKFFSEGASSFGMATELVGDELERFRRAVIEKQESDRCRFQYDAEYKTASDLGVVIETFDRWMYPGRRRKLSN